MLTFQEIEAKVAEIAKHIEQEAEDDISKLFGGHLAHLVGTVVTDVRRMADALEHLAHGGVVNAAVGQTVADKAAPAGQTEAGLALN